MPYKNFNKIPLRKLKHKGQTFLWKRAHEHLKDFEISACSEKLVLFLEGFKNSPIYIIFKEDDNQKLNLDKKKWVVGHTESGVIWLFDETKTEKLVKTFDLNSPKTIVKLIDYYLENGWNPSSTKTKMFDKEALLKLEQFKIFR